MSNFTEARPFSVENWSNRPSMSMEFGKVQLQIAKQSVKNSLIDFWHPFEVLHPIDYYARIRFDRYVRKGKIDIDLSGDMVTVRRLWLWCYQEARHKYEEEIVSRFWR